MRCLEICVPCKLHYIVLTHAFLKPVADDCLSCAKVYSDRWADFVARRLLPSVTYRHVVLTMPEFLRIWFFRDPTLLSPLMLAGNACLKDILNTCSGAKLDIGNIIVLQTAGRSGHYNPHLHILLTGGGLEQRNQWKSVSSGPEDLGARATTGDLERFVIGEPEAMEGITSPYGMALFEGKLYVCDVGRKMVAVFDLRNHTFGYLTKDRRLKKPVNIFIDDNGWKYVADSTAGLVFVFDRDDNLVTMLGQQFKISPIDVVVRGVLCYVTDYASNQVVVMNKVTGDQIMRVGLRRSKTIRVQPEDELPPGEISLISDLALDQQGNIYVTDKAGGRITQFDRSGIFRRTIGRPGDNIDEFVRPKGIAIDRENRIWVVDAATEVAKIYNEQEQLLLFFGLPGNKPGMMNLPAKIVVDYDNVEFFRKYAVLLKNLNLFNFNDLCKLPE